MDFNNVNILQRRMAALKTVKDEMSMGRRDYIFKEKVTNYKPYDGENHIRILPPSWEDALHWGITLYTHYKIGLNQSNFLCSEAMLNKPCPICQEQRKAKTKEEADVFKAKLSVAAYVIDRKNKSTGPSIWMMPHKQIAEPIVIMSDRYTGEYKLIDHPEAGRDIIFNKSGKDLLTRYTAVQMLDPSPLSNDRLEAKQWLDFITSKPLKSLLQFRSYEHISNALHGLEAVDEVKETVSNSPSEELDVDFNKPAPSTIAPPVSDNNQMVKSLLKAMDYNQLISYVKNNNLLIDPTMFDNDGELRDAILMEYGL